MSRTNIANLVGIAVALYVVGGVSYMWYHAVKISRTAVGVEDRVGLFLRMQSNPFWRTDEQKTLDLQTPEFNAYVSRVERRKMLIVAGGLLIAAAFFLVRLLPL